MPDARALAAAYGVRVEFADLGDWGSAKLVAEYDPSGPVIRVNARDHNVMLSLLNDGFATNSRDVERAIAHELYHHREAIGEIPRLRDRAARERAADEFAASVVGADRRA